MACLLCEWIDRAGILWPRRSNTLERLMIPQLGLNQTTDRLQINGEQVSVPSAFEVGSYQTPSFLYIGLQGIFTA
ncbi:MAG: hypothetical protein CME57_06315 [Halieaceae bacterium]|nr:hypothetical protein [Halieaceae bacterium]